MLTIFVIAGPTHAGKTTIVNQLLKDHMGLVRIVTSTSRLPRPDEAINDFHFFTKEEFEKKIANNEFFEWAHVHSDYKGILKTSIFNDIPHNKNAIITVNIEGFINMKKNIDKDVYRIVGIFISPPSLIELKHRMERREVKDDDADIRIQNAKLELKEKHIFDYNVINDDLETFIKEVEEIINKEILITRNLT